jgi:hypothetical protein
MLEDRPGAHAVQDETAARSAQARGA